MSPRSLFQKGARAGQAPELWDNGPRNERELTADLFITLDGFSAGVNVGPYFGYFGPDLERWVGDALRQPQVMIMGRITY
jgi:hypothetical protein